MLYQGECREVCYVDAKEKSDVKSDSDCASYKRREDDVLFKRRDPSAILDSVYSHGVESLIQKIAIFLSLAPECDCHATFARLVEGDGELVAVDRGHVAVAEFLVKHAVANSVHSAASAGTKEILPIPPFFLRRGRMVISMS